MLHPLCCTVTWQLQHRDTFNRTTFRLWMDGREEGSGLEWRQSITVLVGGFTPGDLTIRAKDVFNIVPRRHYLSGCNFRAPRGETGNLGRMLMALETPAVHGPFISSMMYLLLEETDFTYTIQLSR